MIELERIRAAYAALFARLPNAVFTLTGSNSLGTLRAFTWTAASPGGNVADGSDLLGLVNGRIQYHHTSYTIT